MTIKNHEITQDEHKSAEIADNLPKKDEQNSARKSLYVR